MSNQNPNAQFSNVPPFWIHGRDLAAGAVGPFNTMGEVLEHIQFQRKRGDASVVHHTPTITDEPGLLLLEAKDGYSNRRTPEDDRTLEDRLLNAEQPT